MNRRRRRVVVAGGGFAGLYAATYLGAADLPGPSPEVLLLSDRNHFTFTPLLAEVVGGNLGPEHVTLPYRVLAVRRGFRFTQARVEGIDPEAGVLHTDRGNTAYDYVILAFGARSRFFGNEKLARHALPLVSANDAVAIRQRILERAEDASGKPGRRLRFVVAGGGPAGVEAASEIRHLLHQVLPRYYDLGAEPEVILVEGSDRILTGWQGELAATGLELLRDSGIDVRLETLVRDYDGSRVVLERGGDRETLDAADLIWTTGTAPASDPLEGAGLVASDSGHVPVDDRLRARRRERVFAAGDLATLDNPRTGRPYPPVAPIAISQGIRAAGNVENAIADRPPERYQAHHAGKILSLGNGVALVDVLGFQLRGRLAWATYRGAYLLKMVGLKNKLRAGVTLGLNRLFERDLSVLDPR